MDDQLPPRPVALRPVTEDDLAVIDRLANDPEAAGPHEWYGWSDPHVYRHRWLENGLLGSMGGMLMVTRGAEVIGFVNWRQMSTGQISYCWEIGIRLLPEARGQGAGTRAQRLLARYLFAHSQVNRVQAATEITNAAEQRALEKAGFTREGVLRGLGYRDGRWRDGVLYSVLRDEVDLTGGA
ncbi:MAG TPA: GNAT family protein [Streptosporangiaceae bacterium]|jgi:RimJ/RimL family protein N-acetyltransferase